MPPKISSFTQLQVRKRAKHLCEYCHANERWQFVLFTIDHILPISDGGTDSLENLALACFHGNRYKSNKQQISDVQIFNPRQMDWNEHFIWSKDALRILPKTEIGKASIELLQFNRERLLVIRADDFKINRHPPKGDEIEN